MFSSVAAQAICLLLLFQFSATAARLLLPGELIRLTQTTATNSLPDYTEVADFPSHWGNFGPILLLTNGTLRLTPPNSTPPIASNIVAIAEGANFVWLLENSGRAFKWGDSSVTPIVWTNIAQLDVRYEKTLAVTRDGNLIGDNVPPGFHNVKKAIWASPSPDDKWHDFGIGLRTDGRVFTWGAQAIAPPTTLSNIIDIASGNGHFLAVRTDGRVVAWGDNSFGQASPPYITNAVSVFASADRSFAILKSGELLVWGNPAVEKFRGYTGVSKFRDQDTLIGGFPEAAAPIIVSFENRQRRRTGARVKLAAEVFGSLPLRFQWFKNAEPISGATNQILAINSATMSDTGNYSLAVSNALGSGRSGEQTLEIISEPEPHIDAWVTTGAATGPGSLKEALFELQPAPETIGIDYIGDIHLTFEYALSGARRFIGVSPAYTRFRPWPLTRFFTVNPAASLTLENLCLAGASPNTGAAIYNSGMLTISDCILRQNTSSSQGGAIFSSGQLRTERTLFIENRCYRSATASPLYLAGGAIACIQGSVTISNCEFENNSAFSEDALSSGQDGNSCIGGAISLANTTGFITASTFANSVARAGGGGPGINSGLFSIPAGKEGSALGGAIFVTNGAIALANVTMIGNSTESRSGRSAGGALHVAKGGQADIQFSTIVSNLSVRSIMQAITNAGGLSADSRSINLSSSILYLNLANESVNDGINVITGGFNLLTSEASWMNSLDSSGNPLLGPLAQYGGFTRTLTPAWVSPALYKGPTNSAVTLDQRGLPRPQGRNDDIGSVELQLQAPRIITQSHDQILPIGGSAVLNVTADGPPPLSYSWRHNNFPFLSPGDSGTLVIPVLGIDHEGSYTVTVRNPFGAVESEPIHIKLISKPALVQGLTSQVASQGETVSFGVSATGQSPFQYSWFYNDQLVPDVLGPALILTNVSRAQAGTYKVRVQNELGSTESSGDLSFWPTIEVTSLADIGPGTLREAIQITATTPQAYERQIVLPEGSIKLESPLPSVETAVRLTGISAIKSLIDGQLRSAILHVSSSGKLTLETLTIRGGFAGINESGGAIRNDGFLDIRNCMMLSSKTQGGFGGAVANYGMLIINASTLSDNIAAGQSSFLGGAGAGLGGAIYSEASLFMTNATLVGNRAVGGSAGERSLGVSLGGGGPNGGFNGRSGNRNVASIPARDGGFGSGGGQGAGTDFFGQFIPEGGANGGFGGGGGAGGAGLSPTYLVAGLGGSGGYGGGNAITCQLTNDPHLVKAVAMAGGGAGIGGAVFVKRGIGVLVNCTLSFNSATGGSGSHDSYSDCNGEPGSGIAGALFNYQGSVTLKNSILANNTAATQHDDIEGSIESNGHNLIKGFAPDSGVLPSDVITGYFAVQPLADNGGEVFTCAITEGSLALGGATYEVPVDARGVPRIGTADIGAYQLERVQIIRVGIENAEFTLYVHVPTSKTAILQTAETVKGPWLDLLRPLNSGQALRVTFPLSNHTRFARIKPQ